MYDELVKALRQLSDYDLMDFLENRTYTQGIAQEAADAIEEIQGKYFLMKKTAEWLAEKVPRWIPVAERLPEAEWGNASAQVLVTDGECEALAEWFNFEMCEPYWSYTGIGEITHWQPLPQPPKEEKADV